MKLSLPGGRVLEADPATTGPLIMGILNVTPDSFSDGGRYALCDAAVRRGLAMAREGAAVIDVGGESTRPGAMRIEADEQIARTVPVIEKLRSMLDDAGFTGVAISIDTTRLTVAQAALTAGAAIVNDVSAGRESEATMFALAADRGTPLVLMHMLGQPATMQQAPHYGDVVGEVQAFLLERAAAAEGAGVACGQILIDPGIGFGKALEHNLALLAHLDRLVATGYPVLVGASRKRMIGEITTAALRGRGRPSKTSESVPPATQVAAAETAEATEAGSADTGERLGGTCAVSVLAWAAGAAMIRVHDVLAGVQATAMARAIGEARGVE